MNVLKIDNTEVILQNYEFGQGKIIVSNLDEGSFSFYWGSMNATIENFLKSTNADYFAGKLCNEKYVFSGKNTAKSIRKFIKNEMNDEMPWYKFKDHQKELRSEISSIESARSHEEALQIIKGFHNIYVLESDFNEEKEFQEIIERRFSVEPWYFLEKEPSSEYKFLHGLHKKIKSKL